MSTPTTIDGFVKSLMGGYCEPATRLVGEPLGHESFDHEALDRLGAEWLKSCRSAESE